MKSKRSKTYLVSGLTLALIFVAIILVFHDVLPDIVKDLSTVPFWGVLLLLALGFAYEAMESVLCLVIIHHKKPDCTFIDALRVTFLGVSAISRRWVRARCRCKAFTFTGEAWTRAAVLASWRANTCCTRYPC